MSKLKLFAVGILGVGLFAGVASAAITGSAHDFAAQGWSTGQICLPCHTPHNALGTLAPLWNHATTASTFTVYSSTTLNAVPGQPTGTSKACLSCHDGTVGLEAFGGVATNVNHPGASKVLGTDLSNDHPVSFTYDAALVTADGGLKNLTDSTGVAGKPLVSNLLFSGKVECASCHDVHNKYTQSKLLLKSNANSALCLTCHSK